MNNGNYSQKHHTESRPNPKGKKGMPSKAMVGPLQTIAPEDLPKPELRFEKTITTRPAEPSIVLPDGSYSSLVKGPSYGKQYVMPEDQQFTEYDTPGFFEKDGTGEQILDTIGDAATDAYEWGKGAVNSIGGFFSSLFGGGSEDDAKKIVKQKIAQKIAEKQAMQKAAEMRANGGRYQPANTEIPMDVSPIERIR